MPKCLLLQRGTEALPILEKLSGSAPAQENQAKVLILTPTRELAAQILENVKKSKHEGPILIHAITQKGKGY